ncbi:DUF2278 family protein [Wenjunlia tyrosinilytica]|uniref:LTD domain-containing protein n=1 Tax=Wenjunlia tyrosinilytica TaxID=1544741 RepID=A0A918DZ54_9ACTN|nr:DUF2278 family protein [Wenjunlia tyrosinilytica]GGO94330.1 hypothetical protein GCM10012280_48900 [Wenjunlia tyrosinilytica]
MPLKSYGVLIARVVATRREGAANTPHYQIHLTDDQGAHYRAAINVKSQEEPSQLLYLVDDDFRHPLTASLESLPSGWNALPDGPGGSGLDFVRGNLFDPAAVRELPPDREGPGNDLADLFDQHVSRALADPQARLYVFGERWGPEPAVKDKVFGFLPGNGVHDVHMNQGNSGRFQGDNGVWQDGGLLIRFPGAERWVGVFLAFQSQAWHTDDVTGAPLDGSGGGGRPTGGAEPVRVVAALVNPRGPAPEAESVILLNASPDPVDLTGWRIADAVKRGCPVPPGPLAPGATLTVPVAEPVQLGNKGGSITLLDGAGRKVHGVAYTKDQAAREGWTIAF